MDPKKQDLTPELKEIYDRVMNVQVPAGDKNAAPTAGVTAAPTPSDHPVVAPTIQAQTPHETEPTPQPAASNLSEPAGAKSDPFLPSAQPRPLTDDKSFVFTGNKITTPQGSTETHTGAHPQKKISTPIIAAGVIVGVVIWALVWAKIFGIF